MVNGNDLLIHKEQNIDRLTEEFLEENQDKWDEFIMDDFNNNGAE